ncbi:hypothetical protein [Streptomyces microflavus]|uniref:hypothetical protein n=1 Tax=Streptomyces microflavus TaxID=1919 RepID=UPI002E324CE3|nr:hypothetical protein [Streptomyces microflavus]
MGSPAFIARPAANGGYAGVHLQFDSSPPNMVPLLLAAYQFRFRRDLEALSRYLVDDVVFAWDEIGTDLLDGSPPGLLQRLTGGAQWPSRGMTGVMNLDGTPAEREVITQDNSVGHYWGYVLHPAGIEVISRQNDPRGPLISWDTDPRTHFSEAMALWMPGTPPPMSLPRDLPKLTPAPAPTAPTRTATRPPRR